MIQAAASSSPGYSFRPLAYQSADPNDPRVQVDAGERAPQTEPAIDLSPVAATWQTRSGSFPIGSGWEVNEQNSERWNRHQFASLLQSSRLEQFTRNGVECNELHLLRLDLLAWNDLDRRGLAAKPLHEALLEGREHWGSLTTLLAALREANGDDGDD